MHNCSLLAVIHKTCVFNVFQKTSWAYFNKYRRKWQQESPATAKAVRTPRNDLHSSEAPPLSSAIKSQMFLIFKKNFPHPGVTLDFAHPGVGCYSIFIACFNGAARELTQEFVARGVNISAPLGLVMVYLIEKSEFRIYLETINVVVANVLFICTYMLYTGLHDVTSSFSRWNRFCSEHFWSSCTFPDFLCTSDILTKELHTLPMSHLLPVGI